MKLFVYACMMLLFSVVGRAAFFADTDVPLMDNLVVDENESFSFDTPAGQIVTFVAKTSSTAKEVQSFYEVALEELGWQKVSVRRYKRDQDELELQISKLKGQTLVKIQLTFVNK